MQQPHRSVDAHSGNHLSCVQRSICQFHSIHTYAQTQETFHVQIHKHAVDGQQCVAILHGTHSAQTHIQRE